MLRCITGVSKVVTEDRSYVVRRASRPDAKQLSSLAEKTFRDAFEAENTPENMALHCETSYSEAVQAAEIADPRLVTLVCDSQGTLVGFAQLRWGEAPGCVVAAAPGEVQRLYVAREFHGMGVARSLMLACLEEMNLRRSDVVWLGVWEHNPRAIAFYRKFGFAQVGEQIFPLGNDPQRDMVMARPVAGGSSAS
jgi:ribosomal protein S18 acetylase RimI-like enzyme